MIIEFFGPPGSGKTTIARELARHLGDAGIVAEVVNPRVARRRRTSWVRRKMIGGRGILGALDVAWMAMRSATDIGVVTQLARRESLRRRLGRRTPSTQVVILDECAVHWHCVLKAQGLLTTDETFARIRPADLFVRTHVAPDVGLRRIRHRKDRSFVRRMPDDQALTTLENYERAANLAASHLAGAIYEIDTEVPSEPARGIEEVIRIVASRLTAASDDSC